MKNFFLLYPLLFGLSLKAQVNDTLYKKEDVALSLSRFSLSGYGVVNYYNYGRFDTDLGIRDKFDAERLNLYLGYSFSDKIKLKTEIEFEHGGTGSTIELDTQEEFGEYEQEIESGGEVKLEQVYVDFVIKPYFNIRAGRMKLHLNLAQDLDRPIQYFTTHRQEMENEIIPLGWYENGLQFYGTFLSKFRYEFSITNGLDSSGFSSRGWIKNGYQQKFEMVNSDSFAYSARLDYKFGKNKDSYVGFSAYLNDAAANRPKKDMEYSANVSLFTAHITYNEGPLRFSVVGLYGNIENSHIISRKNASLSNKLGVKRTPVGKNALGLAADIGYDVLSVISPKSSQKLYPFVRYEYYDTMYKTQGAVVKKPRWERIALTFGANWFIHKQIVYKIQYQTKQLGAEHIDPITSLSTGKKQTENTFSMGIGFSF